jgi:hypothetical protein
MENHGKIRVNAQRKDKKEVLQKVKNLDGYVGTEGSLEEELKEKEVENLGG